MKIRQKRKKSLDLLNFIEKIIRQKNLFKTNQALLLAVSGGQDSICLLLIFFQLKKQWNWKLRILYCNHLWQKDSFYTISHLFKVACFLEMPFCFVITLEQIFSEQKARNWRYFLFERINGFYNYNFILTGHSASDRIETGLFKFFKGSSPKGISLFDWTKNFSTKKIYKPNKREIVFLTFVPNILIYQNVTLTASTQTRVPTVTQVYKTSFDKPTVTQARVTTLIGSKNKSKIRKKFLITNLSSKFKNSSNSCKSVISDKTFKIQKQRQPLKPISLKKLLLCVSTSLKNQGWASNLVSQDNLFRKMTCETYLRKRNLASQSQPERLPFCQVMCKNKVLIFSKKRLKEDFLFLKEMLETLFLINHKFSLCSADILINQNVSNAGKSKKTVFKKFNKNFLRFTFYLVFFYKKKLLQNDKIKMLNFCLRYLHFDSSKCQQSDGKSNQLFFYSISMNNCFYKSNFLVVRPLFALTRFDIKKLCNVWNLPLYPDQSNQSLNFCRNRIRNQILPSLRFFFNSQIDYTFYRFMDITNEEQKHLDFLTIRLMESVLKENTFVIKLDTSVFNNLPKAIKRRILKMVLEVFVSKRIKFRHIEKLLEVVEQHLKITRIGATLKSSPNLKFFKDFTLACVALQIEDLYGRAKEINEKRKNNFSKLNQILPILSALPSFALPYKSSICKATQARVKSYENVRFGLLLREEEKKKNKKNRLVRTKNNNYLIIIVARKLSLVGAFCFKSFWRIKKIKTNLEILPWQKAMNLDLPIKTRIDDYKKKSLCNLCSDCVNAGKSEFYYFYLEMRNFNNSQILPRLILIVIPKIGVILLN